MLKQYGLFPKIVADLVGWSLAFLLTMRFLPPLEALSDTSYPMPPVEVVLPVVFGFFPLLVMILLLSDLYEISRHDTPFQTFRGLVLAAVAFSAVYIFARILAPEWFAPPLRTVLMTSAIATFIFWLLRTGFPQFYGRSGQRRRALLIGANTFAIRALQRFARENPAELELVGVIDDFKSGMYFENLEAPFLGGMASLPKVVETHRPDVLIVLHDQMEYSPGVIRVLETHPVVQEVYVRAQIPLFVAQDIEIQFVQEVPLLKVFSREASRRSRIFRGILDKTLAIMGLLLTSPFFVVMPLLIRLESRGPIFYRQRRLGLDNQPFYIYKFRSMVADAEKRSGAVLAQKNDPRVTRVGRIMRATRIDEIPQLLNVLKGEMSIIGPRPERPEFQHSYLETIPWYPLRALCKPGITGLAQVNGDYHTSTQRKLLYDVTYLANMSPLLDIRILVATVVTVLTKSGH